MLRRRIRPSWNSTLFPWEWEIVDIGPDRRRRFMTGGGARSKEEAERSVRFAMKRLRAKAIKAAAATGGEVGR